MDETVFFWGFEDDAPAGEDRAVAETWDRDSTARDDWIETAPEFHLPFSVFIDEGDGKEDGPEEILAVWQVERRGADWGCFIALHLMTTVNVL